MPPRTVIAPLPGRPHRAALPADYAAGDWPARIYTPEAPDPDERVALLRSALILLAAVSLIATGVALFGGRI